MTVEDRPRIWQSVADTVGGTPMVELRRMVAPLPARVAVKLESRNPCGSVKDRIGVAMIDDAEARGVLLPGATLVEPTSGNTGFALAFVAAARGYRLVLTMPERMSRERQILLRYLGAELVLTPGTLMGPAVARAQELRASIAGAVTLDQFRNPANPAAHRRTTAEEIWRDTGGDVDCFVCGVGTGGTITGVGEVLKARNPSLHLVAVEPAAAAVLSGGPIGHHLIQGIGPGFMPPLLNRAIVDEVIGVTDEEAFDLARRLAREEGILAGPSSGAVLAAALRVAARRPFAGKRIVAMVCDSGERYATSPLMAALAR